VLDFGIAKLAGGGSSPSATATGAVMIRKIRPTLTQDDAYHAIPGKDPTAGEPSAGGPRG